MSYAPSPRPTFDGPSHIPYRSVTRHLWGDETAGRVSDWIYVSSGAIHQLVFGVGPGGGFGHSEEFRTIFAADEVLYVLGGTMLISNPQTGEVHRVEPGEAAFFRRDTWHHVLNHGDEPLRVLELFSPPPSQGTSGAYSRTKPYLALDESLSTQDSVLGGWPMRRTEVLAADTITRLTRADRRWRLEGTTEPLLVGLIASTEHLTVASAELLPGKRSEVLRRGGEQSLYVTSGTLNLQVPSAAGQSWFELTPGDGFFLPEGVEHQYYNVGGEPAEFVFGVAPRYDVPAESS